MEEGLIDCVVEQREEMKGTCEWLEKNKLSLDTMSIQLDQMNDTMKILMHKQERIKGQVNSWKTKMRNMEKEHNFMDEWQQRNNILIFRTEECPEKSYLDTQKITEDILRMKLKVDIWRWYI
jgi:hypothetical protein